ncbi:MAG: hypothetical protein M1455_03575 [Actinobacteria bacterium]|nr:hypothetical protein [Actinomycetota bacterium]
MLKKGLIGLSIVTIAAALGWVGYIGLAKASDQQQSNTSTDHQWLIPPEDHSDTITAKTTETIQGTRDPDGKCTASFHTSGNTHGTTNLVDPSNCTYVQTLEPGPGPGIPGGPSNEELASGGPCSPQKILRSMESAENAADLTVLTYDEFMAQPPTKDRPKLSFSAHNQAADDKIRAAKFLEFTDSNGSKMTIAVDENDVPLLWASEGTNGSCSGESAAAGGFALGMQGPTP